MTDIMTKTTGSLPKLDRPPVVVLKDFFGLKTNQSLKGFSKELKTLTDTDRDQLTTGIRNESFTY